MERTHHYCKDEIKNCKLLTEKALDPDLRSFNRNLERNL